MEKSVKIGDVHEENIIASGHPLEFERCYRLSDPQVAGGELTVIKCNAPLKPHQAPHATTEEDTRATISGALVWGA